MDKKEEMLLEVEEYALKQKDEVLVLKLLQSSKNLKASAVYQSSSFFIDKAFELGFGAVCEYMLKKRMVSEKVVHSILVNKDVKAIKTYLGYRPPLLDDDNVILLLQVENQKLIDNYFRFWACYIFHEINCPILSKYLKENGLYYDYKRKYLW